MRQHPLGCRPHGTFAQCAAPQDRRSRAYAWNRAGHPPCRRHPSHTGGRRDPARGQTHGGSRLRPDAGAKQRGARRHERRGAHRRHRGVRHLLAGTAAGRIPARLSATCGRPDVRDAICRRAAARSGSRNPARPSDQPRCQGGAARTHPFDGGGGALLSRALRHAEDDRGFAQTSACDAVRRPDQEPGTADRNVPRGRTAQDA